MGRADPVTVGIGFFVHIFGVDWDVQLWAKEISLIFVGCLIISSIKNFLSEVLKVKIIIIYYLICLYLNNFFILDSKNCRQKCTFNGIGVVFSTINWTLRHFNNFNAEIKSSSV